VSVIGSLVSCAWAMNFPPAHKNCANSKSVIYIVQVRPGHSWLDSLAWLELAWHDHPGISSSVYEKNKYYIRSYGLENKLIGKQFSPRILYTDIPLTPFC
jgi:hypothetical protein